MTDPRERTVNAQAVVDLLNEAAGLDHEAMFELVQTRALCNARLAAHPSIQTGPASYGSKGHEVGLLGILNGLFGTFPDGWGCIHAVLDDDPNVPIRFEVRGRREKPELER